MSEDEPKQVHEDESHHEEEQPQRTGLRKRLGRLLNQKDLAEDTREVLGGVWDLSDRAKTEAVRMVAREVRHYLDELRLMEDVKELVKNHSLEVKMSLHLKPLEEALEAAGGEGQGRGTEAPRAEAPAKRKASPAPAPARAEPAEVLAPIDADDDDDGPLPTEEAPRDPTDEEPA